MICNKCGSDLENDAKYCGKCGNKIKNKYDYKQFISKYKNLIIGITVILIGFVSVIINKIEVENISNNMSIADDKETEEKNESIKKEYYDFIDTDYFTFDYTEEELLKIIFFGSSYSQEGYLKSVSTKDNNTTLYTRLATDSEYSGVEIISITTDTRNRKISKFNLSFVSNNNLTEESSNKLVKAYISQGVSILIGNRIELMSSDSDIQKYSSIIKDLGNEQSKGLYLAKSEKINSVEVQFSVKE